FNVAPVPGLYPVSLPDALPICRPVGFEHPVVKTSRRCFTKGRIRYGYREAASVVASIMHCDDMHPVRSHVSHIHQRQAGGGEIEDRKSTRLNSSHVKISYAVFC